MGLELWPRGGRLPPSWDLQGNSESSGEGRVSPQRPELPGERKCSVSRIRGKKERKLQGFFSHKTTEANNPGTLVTGSDFLPPSWLLVRTHTHLTDRWTVCAVLVCDITCTVAWRFCLCCFGDCVSVAQANLELMTFLPPAPECCDYGCAPPRLASLSFSSASDWSLMASLSSPQHLLRWETTQSVLLSSVVFSLVWFPRWTFLEDLGIRGHERVPCTGAVSPIHSQEPGQPGGAYCTHGS